jgi:hypothetical protein
MRPRRAAPRQAAWDDRGVVPDERRRARAAARSVGIATSASAGIWGRDARHPDTGIRRRRRFAEFLYDCDTDVRTCC